MNAAHVPGPTRARLGGIDEDCVLIPELDDYTTNDIVGLLNGPLKGSVLLWGNPDPTWRSQPILQFENTIHNLDQAKLNNQIEERTENQARSSRMIMEVNQSMARDVEKRADESAKQTGRATALTFLAALYLPTTLASGIFGMNVKTWANQIWRRSRNLMQRSRVSLVFTGLCMLGYYLHERRPEAQGKARPPTVTRGPLHTSALQHHEDFQYIRDSQRGPDPVVLALKNDKAKTRITTANSIYFIS
jgi:hypothetical protein